MPRLTEATSAKRRMHILQATLGCLFEQGLAATSVDEVCARAGISKGAFYSHFASKEALIYAVTELLSAELGAVDDTSLAGLADSIFDQRIAPALPPANARFGIEMVAASVSDGVLRDFNIANLENARVGIEQAIRAMIAAGVARSDADAEAVALTFQAYILGVLCRNAIWPVVDAAALRGSVHQLVRDQLAPRD